MVRPGQRQRDFRTHWLTATLALLVAIIWIDKAAAQVGSDRYASIVINAKTGQVLEAANPDALRHPASLTKMMTLYMVFEALRDRRISLDQYVPVSAYASSMEPTKLGLVPGTRITVDQAILGLVTKSANDAACALGEMLGGTEDRFARMMTLRARALGMSRTTFRNASGLPDDEQVTTARDMAVLARRLISDFPSFYGYFSTPSFVWQRRVIRNHDHMLTTYPGADGLKTGYTHASGFNLVTSATRGGVRLIGVVLGAASSGERGLHMASLLNQGFDQMDVRVDDRPVQTASRRLSLISAAHATPTSVLAPVEAPQRPAPPARPIHSAGHWGIQVGSFSSEHTAKKAAAAGQRAADGGDPFVEAARIKNRMTYRAQVIGLTAADARSACATLAKRKAPCIIVKVDPKQVASR